MSAFFYDLFIVYLRVPSMHGVNAVVKWNNNDEHLDSESHQLSTIITLTKAKVRTTFDFGINGLISMHDVHKRGEKNDLMYFAGTSISN